MVIEKARTAVPIGKDICPRFLIIFLKMAEIDSETVCVPLRYNAAANCLILHNHSKPVYPYSRIGKDAGRTIRLVWG